MGISLIAMGNTVVQTGAAGTYSAMVGAGGVPGIATAEAFSAYPLPFACSVSGLTAAQGPVTAPFTITARKNGANATQVIADTAQADTTHADRYLPGDTIDSIRTAGAGGLERMQAQLQLGFVYAQGTQSLMTVTPGYAANPFNGAMDVERLTPTAASGNHGAFVGPCAMSPGGTFTHSVVLKQDGAYPQLLLYLNDQSGGGGLNMRVDLSAGTIQPPGAAGGPVVVGSSITALGGGWFLVTLSGRGFSTNTSAYIYAYNGSTSFVPDGTSGYLVWGSQIDPGAARLQHAAIYASTHSNAGANQPAGAVTYPRTGASTPGGQTVEAQSQLQAGCAGLLSNLIFGVGSNTMTTASTVVSRINGANGAQGFTIAAGLTGIYRDAANADSVARGDLFCVQNSVGTGGSLALANSSFVFAPTAGNQSDIFASGGSTPAATNCYFPPYGNNGSYTTYAAAGVALGFQFNVTRFAVYIATNTGTASSTFNVNKNGANLPPGGTLTGPGLTGWFVSGGGFTTFAPTDVLSFFGASLLAGGQVTATTFCMTLTTPAAYLAWVAEAGAAADTLTAGRQMPLSVDEQGAAIDTSGSRALTRDVVAESGAALDQVSVGGVYPSLIAELGAALDTPTSVNGFGFNVIEQANAADTVTGTSTLRGLVFDFLHAFDVSTPGTAHGLITVTEQGAAVDVSDRFVMIQTSVVEQANARDAALVLGSLAYAQVLGMTARTVHRHPVTGGILDDETIPLLDDQGVPVFEDQV